MVTKARFLEIKAEVQAAVLELFDYVAEHNGNYMLLLADGEYRNQHLGTDTSPYVISYKEDYYKEYTRYQFSEFFLNHYYNWPVDREQTSDTEYRLYIEMMIYSHVWESNKLLKQLYRMLLLANGDSYPWEINNLPENHKHKFIRETVRDGYAKLGLRIAEIISKGFYTSLRNSILHGEFDIDIPGKRIMLHTYRPPGTLKKFEKSEIAIDEWTNFFLYTSFLDYLFIHEKADRRVNVVNDWGTDEFLVVYPRSQCSFRVRSIYFDPSRNDFSFKRTTHPYMEKASASTEYPLPKETPTEVITKDVFDELQKNVTYCVGELLEEMKRQNPTAYICYLFNVTKGETGRFTVPDKQPEALRFDFSGHLLYAMYYNEQAEEKLPEVIRIQLEMLIYCHVWESKFFLQQLNSAIQIVEHAPVDYSYSFPDDRREFIDTLAIRYDAANLQLGKLIRYGFHTSLRDAFAHSDYYFHVNGDEIILDTYKEADQAWAMPKITIQEWAYRFITSVFIDQCFYLIIEFRRKEITEQDLKQAIDKMNQNA